MRADQESDAGGEPAEPAETARVTEVHGEPGTTVGTGSVIGVGCVVGVAVFVLLALALRWFAGVW